MKKGVSSTELLEKLPENWTKLFSFYTAGKNALQESKLSRSDEETKILVKKKQASN